MSRYCTSHTNHITDAASAQEGLSCQGQYILQHYQSPMARSTQAKRWSIAFPSPQNPGCTVYGIYPCASANTFVNFWMFCSVLTLLQSRPWTVLYEFCFCVFSVDFIKKVHRVCLQHFLNERSFVAHPYWTGPYDMLVINAMPRDILSFWINYFVLIVFNVLTKMMGNVLKSRIYFMRTVWICCLKMFYSPFDLQNAFFFSFFYCEVFYVILSWFFEMRNFLKVCVLV